MAFCHCHLHGEFSLLDGCGTAASYAERAVEIGQSAVALTDHENLAGALYHAQECEARGVKAILGMEGYFEPTWGWAKDNKRRGHHILLLAKNMTGFRNLMRLSSIAFQPDRFYYNPIMDWDLLARNSEGLIATTGCVNSYFGRLIVQPYEDFAVPGDVEEVLDQHLNIFGDDFFMEIQPHDFEGQNVYNEAMVSLGRERGIPILATCDAHYPDESWKMAQGTVVALRRGKGTKSVKEEDKDKDPIDFAYPTQWMMTEDEVRLHFAALGVAETIVDEAVASSELIAERCEFFSFDKSAKVPKAAETPEAAEQILREWCEEGLERIGKWGNVEYQERMDYELDMFVRKGVCDYFVIIGDLVRWAKGQGIRIGPCRGSAGASLVLYLSRVTAIDPIGYDLLFERFMNDAREEMPDVDIDFQHNRRDEVRQYLIDKYGSDKVADVAAFQSFGMKSVVNDVCRAFGTDYMVSKHISEQLEDEALGTTLEMIVDAKGHELLAKWRDENPDQWHTALQLEGQIKNMSKHAAAVVVTDSPVRELMPTMRVPGVKVMREDSEETKGQEPVTQWSARANAELLATYGFLKIDLLSTEGLTVQAEAIKLIKERHGVDIDFEDPLTHPEVEFPIGEQEVCEKFSRGSNLGIFQFGGPAARGAAAEIRPTTIDHIIAANAMSRPGPLANLKPYARRKNGLEEWSVPEQAESVLGKTYGILAYQEQVMQLFMVLAGVDPSTADAARRVVGKGVARDKEGRAKLDEMRTQWTRGCLNSGVSKDYAESLFKDLLEMSTYSFNRAHAAGYALQAYQDKWLATHYPLEWYAALLMVDLAKAPLIIREARSLGYDILPPDINESGEGFTLVGDNIRFGIVGIHNVGQVASEAIMQLRPFITLNHFDHKVAEKKLKRALNSKVRQSLVDCGAFDALGERDELSDEEKGELERHLLGFSLSSPSEIARYKNFLETSVELTNLDLAGDEDLVNIVGEITDVKEKKTKNGAPFAFLNVWYEGDDIQVVCWSERLSEYQDLLEVGRAVLISGEWQASRRSVVLKYAMSVSDCARELLRGRE